MTHAKDKNKVARVVKITTTGGGRVKILLNFGVLTFVCLYVYLYIIKIFMEKS